MVIYVDKTGSLPAFIPRKRIQGRISGSFSPVDERAIELVKELGQGEFGQVWKGELDTSRLEASRLPSPEKTMNPAYQNPKNVAVKRFQDEMDRELAFIQELLEDQPKTIPRLFGVLTGYTGEPHLVMKYCNQGSAYDYFNDHIEDKVVCYWKMIDMMTVIHEFHEAGYAHRDIHERNFLLHERKKSGDILTFLTDFGHAIKLGKDKSKVPPLDQRPVFMLNSPTVIRSIYLNCRANNDFTHYNDYLENNAVDIDLYQLGMMLFRITAATTDPLEIGETNDSQMELVRFISIRINMPQFYETLLEGLEKMIPHANESVMRVIASLLTIPPRMTLPEAIQVLKEGVAEMNNEDDSTVFNLSC